MASGPGLRRWRVVRRYMPISLQSYGLYVKLHSSMHVSMYCAPCREGNAVNTGVPCPKVPIHRKLGHYHLLYAIGKSRTHLRHRVAACGTENVDEFRKVPHRCGEYRTVVGHAYNTKDAGSPRQYRRRFKLGANLHTWNRQSGRHGGLLEMKFLCSDNRRRQTFHPPLQLVNFQGHPNPCGMGDWMLVALIHGLPLLQSASRTLQTGIGQGLEDVVQGPATGEVPHNACSAKRVLPGGHVVCEIHAKNVVIMQKSCG
jgi:hypothetical protein